MGNSSKADLQAQEAALQCLLVQGAVADRLLATMMCAGSGASACALLMSPCCTAVKYVNNHAKGASMSGLHLCSCGRG